MFTKVVIFFDKGKENNRKIQPMKKLRKNLDTTKKSLIFAEFFNNYYTNDKNHTA